MWYKTIINILIAIFHYLETLFISWMVGIYFQYIRKLSLVATGTAGVSSRN